MAFKGLFQPKIFHGSLVVRLQGKVSRWPTMVPCPAPVAFPGQEEEEPVWGLQWRNVLTLTFQEGLHISQSISCLTQASWVCVQPPFFPTAPETSWGLCFFYDWE